MSIVVSVIVVALLMIVAATLLAWVLRRTEVSTASFDLRRNHLDIDVDAGDIHIRGSDEKKAVVTRKISYVLFRPHEIEQNTADGLVLNARTRPYLLGLGYVDYDVRVPTDVSVHARSRAGSVEVSHVSGDVDAVSSAGPVTADHLSGRLTLRSSAGDVYATDLDSTAVEAKTGAGRLHLGFTESPDHVEASSGAGPVDVLVPTDDGPYRVDAHSTAGRTTLHVPSDPASPRFLHVTSSAGSVRVHPAAARQLGSH